LLFDVPELKSNLKSLAQKEAMLRNFIVETSLGMAEAFSSARGSLLGKRGSSSREAEEEGVSAEKGNKRQRTGLENSDPNHVGKKHVLSPVSKAKVDNAHSSKRRKFSPAPVLKNKRPRSPLKEEAEKESDLKKRKLKHVVKDKIKSCVPVARKPIAVRKNRRNSTFIPFPDEAAVEIKEDLAVVQKEDPVFESQDSPKDKENSSVVPETLEESESDKVRIAQEKAELEALEQERLEAEKREKEEAKLRAAAKKERELQERIEERKKQLRDQERNEKQEQEDIAVIRDRIVPELQRAIRHKDAVEILHLFYPQAGLSVQRSHRSVQIRKALLRALAHYHPDRKEIRQLPLEERVRAEEIYKIINDCREKQ
jgi:hypothetical protein